MEIGSDNSAKNITEDVVLQQIANTTVFNNQKGNKKFVHKTYFSLQRHLTIQRNIMISTFH